MPTMRFSIVFDLPRSRWSETHLLGPVPERWPMILVSMRSMRNIGNSTELVTAFVDYFDGPPDPSQRRLT